MTTTEQIEHLRKLAADTPTSDPRKRAMNEAADELASMARGMAVFAREYCINVEFENDQAAIDWFIKVGKEEA